jgi:hypothetical protein
MGERGSYTAQMMALVSEFLPGYALYYSQNVVAWVSSLQGPSQGDVAQFGKIVRPSTNYWDIENWYFK